MNRVKRPAIKYPYNVLTAASHRYDDIQGHIEAWSGCTACPLCETRTHVVLGRGHLPCSLLFIGEAPGPDEDVTGSPFIGKAGKLLDKMIAEAEKGIRWKHQPAYAITNAIACFPKNTDPNVPSSFRAPSKEEIQACSPRLMDFIELAFPRLPTWKNLAKKNHLPRVICVGKEAIKAVKKLRHPSGILEHLRFSTIVHPGYINRNGGSSKSVDYERTVLTLHNIFVAFNKCQPVPPGNDFSFQELK